MLLRLACAWFVYASFKCEIERKIYHRMRIGIEFVNVFPDAPSNDVSGETLSHIHRTCTLSAFPRVSLECAY